MHSHRIILLVIVVSTLIGASYLIHNSSSNSLAPAHVSLGLEGALPGPQGKTTDELIKFWRSRVERNPDDFISLAYVGQLFLHRARETGDIADYVRAEAAFQKSLDVDPQYEAARGYMSAVLLAKHDFQGALELANQVYAFDPHALLVLGTIGDAQMELGNYSEAGKAYQQLLEGAPSPPVYSRLARLAWLQGHTKEALDLMQQATDEAKAAGDAGEEAAWYQFQLGELYFNSGQAEEAAKHYTAALGFVNNYYLALAGLGKVRAAEGHYEEAIQFYERAVAIIPQPLSLSALGDLYTITGQPAKARLEYDTVEFIGKLAAINQVVYNRELALFDANHDQKLDEALNLATKELAVRKDIYGYDTLAWALYKNGRNQEAAETINQALKLGTRDALLYYHAGMIDEGLGDHDRARSALTEAFSINPNFDPLQARIARTTLERVNRP